MPTDSFAKGCLGVIISTILSFSVILFIFLMATGQVARAFLILGIYLSLFSVAALIVHIANRKGK